MADRKFVMPLMRFAAFFSAIGACASSALAAPPIIEDAKEACVVGEGIDGYLGYVPDAQAGEALRREVRDINLQRKNVYADLARRNGVSVEATAKLAAEKLINGSPLGQCVQNEAGEWVRR